MAKRLTEKRVRDLRADPGKTTFEWDAGLGGFGVRVSKGGVKAYVLWVRSDGRKRLVTLGRSPELSLDAARVAATSELDQLARGGADLLTRRAEAQAAMSVSDGTEWFLNVHVPRRQGLQKMGDRTAVEYRRQIRTYIAPALGHLKIKAVRRQDIEAMLDKIGWDKPAQFSRVRALVCTLFNLFETEGWRTEGPNPAKRIITPTERPRTRVLNATEQSGLLAALAQLGQNPATQAVQMLYQTGARMGEVRLLRWEHVDIDGRVLRLDASKTGPKAIALTAEALDVLTHCPKVSDNPHVFPGTGTAPMGSKTIRATFHKAAKMAGLEDIRPHDLRRSMITDAIDSGVPLTLVARLAGHSTIIMTSRYARHASEQVHAAGETMAAARREKRGADVIAPKFGTGRRA